MIDRYVIEPHFKLGPQDWLKIKGYANAEPPPAKRQIVVKHPDWMGQQTALLWPDNFRLEVCPSKVQGRWNTWGTDDLRRAVSMSGPMMMDAMGVAVTPEMRMAFDKGQYTVWNIDVTHHFHLPGYESSDFLIRLFRLLNESHPVSYAKRGVGFHLDPSHRKEVAYFYDKLVEMESKKVADKYAQRVTDRPQRRELGFREVGLILDLEVQLLVASLGPRLEFKFGREKFRGSPLEVGANWTPDTATDLYKKALAKLKLPKVVKTSWLRNKARHRLDAQVFRSLLLWSHGEAKDDIAGSPTTYARHRKAILELVGLDINFPPPSALRRKDRVDLRKVFRWENRVIVEELNLDGFNGR